MQNLKFYKTETNRWYVDLPSWEGSQAELEMVCGADYMLEIIAQGEDEVYLNMSLEPFNNCETLEKIEDTPSIGGATYLMKTYKGYDFYLTIWLCEVTRFALGDIPQFIYFK